MRRISKKMQKRIDEVADFRRDLIATVGQCEICNYIPGRHWRWPPGLVCHEISRGPLRQKSLDKSFAILILCIACHEDLDDRKEWPDARQLAALKRSRPEDFSLQAFNLLVNPNAPNRVMPSEVDIWLARMP